MLLKLCVLIIYFGLLFYIGLWSSRKVKNIKGLWINSGHGHLGWTMSSGSAILISDLIEGKKPSIDPLPYRIDR